MKYERDINAYIQRGPTIPSMLSSPLFLFTGTNLESAPYYRYFLVTHKTQKIFSNIQRHYCTVTSGGPLVRPGPPLYVLMEADIAFGTLPFRRSVLRADGSQCGLRLARLFPTPSFFTAHVSEGLWPSPSPPCMAPAPGSTGVRTPSLLFVAPAFGNTT